MTDTSPKALDPGEVAAQVTRALAAEIEAGLSWRRTAERCHKETLTARAALTTAARDARRDALEEAAKFLAQQAKELSVYRDQWPIRDENLRNAAAILALIDREPEPVVQDKPAQWPRYELKFIMRVLGHKGVAPREDWETAYGMAKDILLSLPAVNAVGTPVSNASNIDQRPPE